MIAARISFLYFLPLVSSVRRQWTATTFSSMEVGKKSKYLQPPTDEERSRFKAYPSCSEGETLQQCQLDTSIFLTPDGGVGRAPGLDSSRVGLLEPGRLTNPRMRDYLLQSSHNTAAPLPTADIRCPQATDSSEERMGDQKGYEKRATKCAGNAFAMWANDWSCSQFCKTLTVGAIMSYMPSQKVFDWGAGCGLALSWLEDAFGVSTTGHELVAEAAENAELFTGAKSVCHGDGRDLSHIPENAVDHVIANAAVHHLAPQEQCDLMLKHFLRMVRPGGTVWVGWNAVEYVGGMHGQERFKRDGWTECLNQSKWEIIYDMPLENQFFGMSEGYAHETFSVMVVKLS